MRTGRDAATSRVSSPMGFTAESMVTLAAAIIYYDAAHKLNA